MCLSLQVDPSLARSLQYILDTDLDAEADLHDYRFEYTFPPTLSWPHAEPQVVELVPGGGAKRVTNANKANYAHLLIQCVMESGPHSGFDKLREGFRTIIPARMLRSFGPEELQRLLEGSMKFNVDDFQQHCAYEEPHMNHSPVAEWFWRAVRTELSPEQHAALLQFWSGSDRPPSLGYERPTADDSSSHFRLEIMSGSSDQLPTAAACTRLLRLPRYRSYEALKEKLLIAITHGAVGYHES